MRRLLLLALVGMLAAVGILTLKTRWDSAKATERLRLAHEALGTRDFPAAREHAESAMTWFVSHDLREAACLITGRAYLEDEKLTRIARLPKAMEFLSKIPRHSNWYPEMALAMAQDQLLEAKSPRDALNIIDDALRDWPNDVRLNSWKIVWLTVTNRSDMAEPYFVAAAKHKANDGEEILQVWLMSQFNPESLEAPFDRQLGVAGKGESTTDTIRLERWTTLKNMNLRDATSVASIATWYLDRGFLTEALDHLREGRAVAEMSPDPHFLSVSVRAFCEAGQTNVAESLLAPLQQLAPGYRSHVAAARVALARNQPSTALEELLQARKYWPGQIDLWVSTTLEQLYRQNGDEESLSHAKSLAEEREWFTAQRHRLPQVLARKIGPTERAWLMDFLARLNRNTELEILNRSP